jgi:hypothetical protein
VEPFNRLEESGLILLVGVRLAICSSGSAANGKTHFHKKDEAILIKTVERFNGGDSYQLEVAAGGASTPGPVATVPLMSKTNAFMVAETSSGSCVLNLACSEESHRLCPGEAKRTLRLGHACITMLRCRAC